MGRLYQQASNARAARLAQEWYDRIDPKGQVGTRHHIVPRTLLRRFANDSRQVRVRDRFTSKIRLVSVGDLAVKDFYTFIDLNLAPNGSMEVWLSEVEGEFARAIGPYFSPTAFERPKRLTGMRRFAVDTFVAVQVLRGMRTRRAMELIADYGVKFVNQDQLDATEIQDLEIFPHQNEHIQYLHRGSEQVADHLSRRPVTVARFDAPLLAIGDEPVVLIPRDGAATGDVRKRLVVEGERVPPENLIQVSNGLGVGLYDADEIVLPLGPRHALVYGALQSPSPESLIWDLKGTEAIRIAREVNRLQARNAFGWVAAHPDGPRLDQIPWPPPAPAITIYDDHSVPAAVVNARPHTRPRRFSR